MKFFLSLIAILFLTSCEKTEIYEPVGGMEDNTSIDSSKERNKKRNEEERKFIENWIRAQKTPYFSTTMNYWSNINFNQRKSHLSNQVFTYEMVFYDFDNKKIYDSPILKSNVNPIKINEIIAVTDALHYLKDQEEVRLLVPSSLAYGIQGDENKIPRDLPLIVDLKLVKTQK